MSAQKAITVQTTQSPVADELGERLLGRLEEGGGDSGPDGERLPARALECLETIEPLLRASAVYLRTRTLCKLEIPVPVSGAQIILLGKETRSPTHCFGTTPNSAASPSRFLLRSPVRRCVPQPGLELWQDSEGLLPACGLIL